MKMNKDLRVSIACFDEMLAWTNITPQQKKAVRQAKALLRKLARKRLVTKEEAEHFVKEVCELLAIAFINKDD